MFISSRLNLKIAYGFVVVSLVVAITGAISYSNLLNVRRSFAVLEESISKQILRIEEIRGNYSLMLLEMTTFLLLDPKGEDRVAQLTHFEKIKNDFGRSLEKFDEYFKGENKPQNLEELKSAGERSLLLVNRIIELRKNGRPLGEILPLKENLKKIEDDEFFPLIDKLITGNKLRIENEKRTVDGVLQDSLLALVALAVVGFAVSIGVGYVISSREREVDKFRDQLISVAAHQLRTPITIMKGYAELLEEEKGLPVRQKSAASAIKDGAKNLAQTVDDLLDLSRIEGGKFKLEPAKASFCGLVGSVVGRLKGFAEKNKAVVVFSKPKQDFSVFVDESRIRQAVNNILDNAIKYSKPECEVKVAIKDEGKTALLSIKDNGIGIPKQEQKTIFTKFFRASNTAGKARGSGLGLFLVKTIVEQSGGKIWFESGEGVGTTFFVRLPKYS